MGSISVFVASVACFCRCCCYCCCYVLAIREQDNGLSMFVDGLYCFGNDIGCPCPWQYVYDVSEYKQINVYRNWHTIERSLHFMCVLLMLCLSANGWMCGWAVGWVVYKTDNTRIKVTHMHSLIKSN